MFAVEVSAGVVDEGVDFAVVVFLDHGDGGGDGGVGRYV